MVMCFVPDCKHYSERERCHFYRFARDEKVRKQWIRNIRRADREPSDRSVVCSCHFVDGLKANGPTTFNDREKFRLLDKRPFRKHMKMLLSEETSISSSDVKPLLTQCKIEPNHENDLISSLDIEVEPQLTQCQIKREPEDYYLAFKTSPEVDVNPQFVQCEIKTEPEDDYLTSEPSLDVDVNPQLIQSQTTSEAEERNSFTFASAERLKILELQKENAVLKEELEMYKKSYVILVYDLQNDNS